MNEKLRTIRLYGTLGAKFGREYRLAVGSVAEAVHALSTQLPGFKRFLMESKDRGMAFAVFHGRQNLREDQLLDPPGNDAIRIAPVLAGAKRGGVFQVILGAALIIAAGFFTGGAGWSLAIGAGGMAGVTAGIGLSLVVGGITQMLAPNPRGLGAKDSPSNQPSYIFNGPVNTQAQGNPVPVAYGQCWAGSAVISAGIYAEDEQ
ncbi:tail assembly protein [Lysobacter sp.]|uniref:tail assembly protein n=1 Tax=Lysobacter sp. TaxID=72226 RepID=UPI002D7024DF|nr:tail assembly protein [Lysobacter sp.]HZX76155.1 tail assembly protein [Lysobacter sp.]